MAFAKLKITPRSARYYLFFAALLILAPTILVKFFPSHAGRVLVSAGKMNASIFQHSVIYITQHHAYLAIGFIINRPMPDELKEKYQKRFPNIRHFHYGGPVGTQDQFFLMVPDEKGMNGFTIYNGGFLQEKEPEKFNEIISDENIASQTRIFAGYSGWGPMQLNREIFNGWWDDTGFENSYISDAPGNEIWDRAVKKVLSEKKVNVDAI